MITPLLTHWSYWSLALSHPYELITSLSSRMSSCTHLEPKQTHVICMIITKVKLATQFRNTFLAILPTHDVIILSVGFIFPRCNDSSDIGHCQHVLYQLKVSLASHDWFSITYSTQSIGYWWQEDMVTFVSARYHLRSTFAFRVLYTAIYHSCSCFHCSCFHETQLHD